MGENQNTILPGDKLLEAIMVIFGCEKCGKHNDPIVPEGMAAPRFFYCWFCGFRKEFESFESAEKPVKTLHLVGSETQRGADDERKRQ